MPATGVEVVALRGTAQVVYGTRRDRRTISKDQKFSAPIQKDRPVIINVSQGGRATAQSTTGIVLLIEHEDADGFTHEEKLNPPFKQALTGGKWVVMAPSAK